MISEIIEHSALKRLCSEVSDHVASRAPFDGQLSFVDSICDKEETDVNVLLALAARSFTIFLQKNGTLVVL